MSQPINIRRSASCSSCPRPPSSHSAASSPAALESMLGDLDDMTFSNAGSSNLDTFSDSIFDMRSDSDNDMQNEAPPPGCDGSYDPHFPIDESLGSTVSMVINGDNAQHILPPDACIFVANLPKNMPDMHIRSELEQAFLQFGNVYVKVRRDHTHLPVAFVQYTKREHAQKALSEGQGIRVGGRPVRIEIAKCERTLFCSHKLKDHIDSNDLERIRELLQDFGEIERIQTAPEDQQAFYYLPKGVWCHFKLYGSCQDAFKALCRHNTYRFELFRDKSTSLRLRPYPSSHVPKMPAATRNAAHYAGIKSVAHTSKHGSIILVDGMPTTTTKPQLRELFKHFGTVTAISIQHQFHQNHGLTPPWFHGYVCFKEEFAGPAVQAFSARHGFCIQDAHQLVWALLAIEVIFVNADPFNGCAMQTFDMSQYHQYMQGMIHPIVVAHPAFMHHPSKAPHWMSSIALEPIFDEARLRASAPGLGAKASIPHAQSVSTVSSVLREPNNDALVSSWGRTYSYAMAQRLYTADDLLGFTPLNQRDRPTIEDPSGLSPLR
ncbi:hypothetical protein BDZ85DRAFT_284758 [Elsinoe ampelina]|uniref:RRM domain-containing protein n=1 Tax=Elsinoe ampelina TaxID=302913 RepID=A0A6A6G438_9PEZI|nr:hypothetical protein BDZ85DRAFT_284758 [Elsinoe ampelina]